MLNPGRSGLGFGVGTEPLQALFASFGVDILASDQGIEGAVMSGWTQTNQHSKSSWGLNSLGICHPNVYEEKVRFWEFDMNNIDSDLLGEYDFCWSACFLEQLVLIPHVIYFVIESLKSLKSGDIADHSKEFNMYSDNEILDSTDLSVFRKRDIDAVVNDLTNLGHTVDPIDWSLGDVFLDGYIDLPAYR